MNFYFYSNIKCFIGMDPVKKDRGTRKRHLFYTVVVYRQGMIILKKGP